MESGEERDGRYWRQVDADGRGVSSLVLPGLDHLAAAIVPL